MTEKIKKFVASRTFLSLVIALFLLQGVWFAASLKSDIPPDEGYHYGFISIYAEQPISHGPIITSQPANSLYLGDVEQTPSFLYHYLMNFPLRIVSDLTSNRDYRVLSLRLIDVVFGVLCLVVLKKIFRKAGFDDFLSNFAVALFAMTGMFIWISAAISYDVLSMLMWFGLIWSLLCLQDRISRPNVAKVLVFSIATALVKVTYAPVILIVLCAYAFINRGQLNDYKKALLFKPASKKSTAAGGKKIPLALLALCLTILVIFAADRYGSNVVRYHSISPSCQKVHSVSACSVSSAVQRSNKIADALRQFKQAGGHIPFTPVSFAGDWTDKMYQRAYFYFGKKAIVPNIGAELVLVGTLLVTLLMLTIKRFKLVENNKEWLLFSALAAYVSLLFLLNFHSHMSSGNDYGYQGRYLLPVLPFAYIFLLKLSRQTLRKMNSPYKPLLATACIVLLVAFVYEDFPGIVFLKGTDASWYSQQTTSTNLKLKHAMIKSRLFQRGSLQSQ